MGLARGKAERARWRVTAGEPLTLRAACRATREPAVIVFEPPPNLEAFPDKGGHPDSSEEPDEALPAQLAPDPHPGPPREF